ncbi:hypothetical protein HYW67_04130 [Candidatus Parcubacteria bacterium]|nr:hypothetical protein [Candidatus Parcubacteria bacterium]
MGTPNSPTSFRVHDLRHSDDPAVRDHDGAARATEVVAALLHRLKPVLEHIAVPFEWYRDEHPVKERAVGLVPQRVRNVTRGIDSLEELFLGQNGKFFVVEKTRPEHQARLCFTEDDGQPTWEFFFFDEVVSALRDALARAEKRRETSLIAIRKRRELLDEVLATIKRAETA